MRVSFSRGAAARGLVLVSALLLSTAAFAAPDAKTVADSIVAAVQAKGEAKATYEAATASGDNVTITNFKVTSSKGGDMTIPSIVVSNPAERQPGGFTASSIAFDGGSVVDGDNTIAWKTGITNDSIVPHPSEMHSTTKLTPFSHLGLGGISISQKSQPAPVTIDQINIDLSNVVDGTPNDGKLSISGINVPGAVLQADEQAKAVFEQLGYDSLLLNVTIEGGYDTTKNAATIRTITIDGKDMGKLEISGAFGGLAREKLQNVDQLKELASTATLESATIHFQDAGITNRVLEMQAKSMGTTRDSLAMMLPAALPLAFSQVNITDAAFQQKVVDAVTAFLKDPKSFTVSVAPATPILLKDVGSTAMSAPQTLPSLLALDIKSNN